MSAPLTDATRDLLREAAEWRLLALLFERPRPGWHAEVAALAAEVEDELLREAALAAADADERIYLRLIGPGGIASPRESAWRGRLDPGQILAALRLCYEAFAFAPAAEDPPDHVAVEAAFVGYLALKTAYAQASGQEPQADLCIAAAAAFREDHLRAMAGPLCERLGTHGWLGLAAEALLQRTGPPEEEVAPECDTTDQAACGLGGCPLEPEARDLEEILGPSPRTVD